ncbi:MAG: class II aldolase/adducin family protein, partial [Oscillospiraceae bacterium]|nr:class II aldolase/adducin family protein [Oscillospiraceae bacterium]
MSYRINDEYPSDYEAKQAILEVGRRMYAKNFVAANDGNISCKVSDHSVWCTPTGVSKGYMTDEMLVLMDLDGNVLKGSWKPSSEMKMHLRVYTENPKVKAVVHAHPPAATSYAIAGLPLNHAILTEAVMGIGEIPIAPYAMPGTQEVPDSIAPFVNTHNGCLLANHGALTWGKDVMEAWMRMESVEYYALVSMYTHGLIGQANELTCDQVDRLIERRTRSGITTGGRPLCRNCGADGTPACVKCGSPAAV